MSNAYFRFKQFTVHQQSNMMKVSTDACLFGAYLAENISQQSLTDPGDKNILDIGTGTGLLSLMLAQKVHAKIDAIELNPPAAKQAKKNFAESPWHDRLTIFEGDVRNFSFIHQYDHIICNPPFFNNHLTGKNELINLARHTIHLNYEDILKISSSIIKKDGWLAILLPYDLFSTFQVLAKKYSFHLMKSLLIRQTTQHAFFRQIGIFSFTPAATVHEEISIMDSYNNYTANFITLLSDYYLHL